MATRKRGSTPTRQRRVRKEAEQELSGILSGTVIPAMSKELAAVYAKMLAVGCPPVRATLYVIPSLPIEEAQAITRQWLSDTLVVQAANDLHGGSFFDLDKEKRFELALDKMYAEMAFFCWTSNWCDAVSKEDLEKMKQAREELKVLTGRKVDDQDPMQAFARFAIELARGLEKRPKKQLPKPEPDTDLLDAVGLVIESEITTVPPVPAPQVRAQTTTKER